MLIENGKLLMDIRISGIENRHVKVVVVPFSDSEAYVFGLGRNVGDVARVLPDGDRQRDSLLGVRVRARVTLYAGGFRPTGFQQRATAGCPA